MALRFKSLFAVFVALFFKFTFAQNLESVLANHGWNINKTYECVLVRMHHGPSFDSLQERDLSQSKFQAVLARFEGQMLITKWHPDMLGRPESEPSLIRARFSGEFDNQGHPIFLREHRSGVNRLTMWRVGSYIMIGELFRVRGSSYISYSQYACS